MSRFHRCRDFHRWLVDLPIGRRLACILFGLFYGLGCVSFHFHSSWILAIGTIPWGIASALDQTAIETWLIAEHRVLSLDTQSLTHILRNTSVTKILLSIGVAFLSHFLVQSFGFIAPFDVAIVVVFIMIIFIQLKWSENHGNKQTSSTTSFTSSIKILGADFRIVLLGLSTSFFEATVYIYGIEWTPTLQSAKSMIIHDPIPLGICFAGQMLFRFIGTMAFGPLAKRFRAQSFMIIIFLLCAVGLSIPIFLPNAQWPILVGFFLSEFCVGVYRPAASLLRSEYIPNEIRATVMSYLRVPQLLLVVGILLFHFPLPIVFIMWVSMVLLAMLCMIVLRSLKIPGEEELVYELVIIKDPPLFQFITTPFRMKLLPAVSYMPHTSL